LFYRCKLQRWRLVTAAAFATTAAKTAAAFATAASTSAAAEAATAVATVTTTAAEAAAAFARTARAATTCAFRFWAWFDVRSLCALWALLQLKRNRLVFE
jgi:hypothetical protein